MIALTSFVASEFCATAAAEFFAVTSARSDIPYRSLVTVNVQCVAPTMVKHGPVGEVHFFH